MKLKIPCTAVVSEREKRRLTAGKQSVMMNYTTKW